LRSLLKHIRCHFPADHFIDNTVFIFRNYWKDYEGPERDSEEDSEEEEYTEEELELMRRAYEEHLAREAAETQEQQESELESPRQSVNGKCLFTCLHSVNIEKIFE
jgi:hypothetical protein